MKRALLATLLLGSSVALAGCGMGGGTVTAGPTTAPASGTPSAEPTASSTPAPAPSPSAAATAGDCVGTGDSSIPVVYTVWADDSTTPFTVSYMAFNSDGSTPVVTETHTGPVFTKVGYACTTAASGAVWTLTATTTTSGKLACTLAFGGMLVKQDSQYAEHVPAISITADCSGNPGM